jgi:hypothetical protein
VSERDADEAGVERGAAPLGDALGEALGDGRADARFELRGGGVSRDGRRMFPVGVVLTGRAAGGIERRFLRGSGFGAFELELGFTGGSEGLESELCDGEEAPGAVPQSSTANKALSSSGEGSRSEGTELVRASETAAAGTDLEPASAAAATESGGVSTGFFGALLSAPGRVDGSLLPTGTIRPSISSGPLQRVQRMVASWPRTRSVYRRSGSFMSDSQVGQHTWNAITSKFTTATPGLWRDPSRTAKIR